MALDSWSYPLERSEREAPVRLHVETHLKQMNRCCADEETDRKIMVLLFIQQGK